MENDRNESGGRRYAAGARQKQGESLHGRSGEATARRRRARPRTFAITALFLTCGLRRSEVSGSPSMRSTSTQPRVDPADGR